MNDQMWIVYVIGPIVGYLLGSIPWAWVIGKAKGVDIRTVGSKNVGATNLGRTLGRKYFWYGFLLDALKGFVPVLVVSLLVRRWRHEAMTGEQELSVYSWTPLLTAIACVLGHNFPIWLKFKGGKGVATSFGVVLGFWPIYTLAGIGGGLFFVFVLMIYRYISLASITAAIFFATLVCLIGSGWVDKGSFMVGMGWHDLQPLVVIAWLFAALIILKHKANIRRLLAGTEPKIGQKKA